MKKLLLTFVITTFAFSTALAEDFTFFDDSSGVASKYLDINVGAAGAGMGNAYIGMAKDAAAIFWNPAGLSNMRYEEKDWNFFFSQNVWFMDVLLSHASLAKNIKKLGVFAGSISYFHGGSIDTVEEANGYPIFNSDRTFSPYSFILSGAYSGILDQDIDYGIVFKYILENLDGDIAHAFAFDVGIRYFFTPLPGLAFNIVAKNFAGMMNDFIVPRELTFAVLYTTIIEGYTITADIDVCGKIANNPLVKYGLEIKFPFIVTLRAGYQMDNTTIQEGFKDFTFGVGLNLYGKHVDFAYEPYGELGTAYKFSFGGDF